MNVSRDRYISCTVGCLFGRYSLDKPGLVLANAGDGIKEYYRQIPQPILPSYELGILPLTGEDNLRFIEDELGKNLRSFLLKDFYKDHVKRYNKNPIY